MRFVKIKFLINWTGTQKINNISFKGSIFYIDLSDTQAVLIHKKRYEVFHTSYSRYIPSHSQPIQLVIQRTLPRMILTTRIIKQNSSTHHRPFRRYKIGRRNKMATNPTIKRIADPLFRISYYTLRTKVCPKKSILEN